MGRSSAAPLRCVSRGSVRGRGEVGLAVVYLIRGVFCFDFEGVELAVGGGRGEGQAVFVAD